MFTENCHGNTHITQARECDCCLPCDIGYLCHGKTIRVSRQAKHHKCTRSVSFSLQCVISVLCCTFKNALRWHLVDTLKRTTWNAALGQHHIFFLSFFFFFFKDYLKPHRMKAVQWAADVNSKRHTTHTALWSRYTRGKFSFYTGPE